MTAARPAALTALLLLAGCATLGTNVNGSFACSAPDGICAPSSVIDDRALALIAGEASETAPARAAGEPSLLRSRALPPGQVALAEQKTLRIVFPAHVDALGRYHEQSAVRALVDQGVWLAGETAGPGPLVVAAPKERLVVSASTAQDQVPSAAVVEAARVRGTPPALSREEIAREVEGVLAAPKMNRPAGFPARVED